METDHSDHTCCTSPIGLAESDCESDNRDVFASSNLVVQPNKIKERRKGVMETDHSDHTWWH